ncbi:MAG: hypothetical protein H7Y86_09615 [Rhizobacter sp.]|nr:hypothetical protein [Ferruginibacter sp.]
MKNTFLLVLLCFSTAVVVAQNVGIGVSEPTQKLEVNGAVKVGTTVTNQAGTIRYNGVKFEGGDGTNWKSLEGTASGIVGSRIYNNPALLNAGYDLMGEIPGISRYFTINTAFFANTWQPTYTRGIVTSITAPSNPPGAALALAVWTGSLMYVAAENKLYVYDPVTDVWNLESNQGVGLFQGIKAVWTGSEIIFWGANFIGSRYNPATNIWTELPATNAPSPRGNQIMIWDGTRVIIWGGNNGIVPLNTGAMYNPATNTWTTMSTSGAPTARLWHTAVWNNVAGAAGRIIIWGGTNVVSEFSGELNTGGIFDPSTNTWTATTNTVGAPSARINHTAIWTGTEMIIFGGRLSNTSTNTGSRFNPSSNTWTTITNGPQSVTGHSSVWTGTAMFVTGGSNNSSGNTGFTNSNSTIYNPTTNSWATAPSFSSTDSKRNHNSFFAGNMILIWGGEIFVDILSISKGTNTGYRYFLTNTVSSATTLINETLYLYQKY